MSHRTITPPARKATRVVLIAALATAFILLVAGFAEGTRRVSTYAEYSMHDQRRAGQLWSGGAAASQWAWAPQPDGSSHIRWGDPTAWPPPNYERFRRVGDWVLLEGYGDDSGAFARQVVTREQAGDINCANPVPIPLDPQGRQHYVKWVIPTSPYCIQSWGYIDYLGTRVDFYHKQVWFPPSGLTCTNAYISNRQCIKQHERWSDNNGNPGGPLVQRHYRDNILAKGIGPGFIIHNWDNGWHADLRYWWAW